MRSQIAQSSNRPYPCPYAGSRVSQRGECKPKRKNRYLEGFIQELISDYSAAQNHQPSFYVQASKRVETNLGGTDEELDVLELNDLDDLLTDDQMENRKNSSTIWQSRKTEFMKKIDEDVASSIGIADFIIDGEHTKIGKYSFPLSLVPTVEKIIDIYGDVSAMSLMNSYVTGKIYLFFCATIKEMEDLQLSEVTEEKMLKWRDAIKDALRINFKVDFAMEHLKRIARAYFGRIGSQVIQSIDEKLNALYKERAETYDNFKDCMADAEEFNGKPLSSGLFP